MTEICQRDRARSPAMINLAGSERSCVAARPRGHDGVRIHRRRTSVRPSVSVRWRVLVWQHRLHSPTAARHVRQFSLYVLLFRAFRWQTRAPKSWMKHHEDEHLNATSSNLADRPFRAIKRRAASLHLFYVTNVRPAKGDDRCAHANINGKWEQADRDYRKIDEGDRHVLAVTSEAVKVWTRRSFFTVMFKATRGNRHARFFLERASCTDEIAWPYQFAVKVQQEVWSRTLSQFPICARDTRETDVNHRGINLDARENPERPRYA